MNAGATEFERFVRDETTSRPDRRECICPRWLARRLPSPISQRVVVLTGARGTGKHALARARYPALADHDLEDDEARDALRASRPGSWRPAAAATIVREAQREPSVAEALKAALESDELEFTVLLGSSRFSPVTEDGESLAEHTLTYEVWPLMVCELGARGRNAIVPPLLDRFIDSKGGIGNVLTAEPNRMPDADERANIDAIAHLARWGGMPELLTLDDAARCRWLKAYQQSFIERDVAELTRLGDLRPFRRLQRECMMRTAGLLSYAELGRDAGISAPTARRYLEHLLATYQVFLLPPFGRNLTSSAVKSAKLFWMDLGVLREETERRGPLDDHLFETLVVGEIRKWIDSAGKNAEMTFYRTRSGLEVDLILRTPAGVIGIEIENREHAARKDLGAMRSVADALGEEWRGGLIVHRGAAIELEDEERAIYSVPAHRLL